MCYYSIAQLLPKQWITHEYCTYSIDKVQSCADCIFDSIHPPSPSSLNVTQFDWVSEHCSVPSPTNC